MPRPSLKAERSAAILQAYTSLIARYGLEGATQDRIAAAAGVKRPILRHYLGNRDEMVDALIDHLGAGFDADTEALAAALPESGRIEALLEILFSPQAVTAAERVLAFQAMVAAAERHPKVKPVLVASLSRFLALIEVELARAYPAADEASVAATAQGLMGIYFTVDALAPLNPPEDWRAGSRLAADALVRSLEGGTS